MVVRLDEVMKGFSPERRAKIERAGARIVEESTLAELRAAVGVTQKTVAGRMHISQASLAELERRRDPKISTLRRAVEAIGGELHIYAEVKGKRVPLAIASKTKAPISHVRMAAKAAPRAKPRRTKVKA
jgi:transcriptional regulator with XRE-family HTH domain